MCTTELGVVGKLAEEWKHLNVKPIGLSVDSIDSHHSWIKDIEETQTTKVNFPIIADKDKKIANAYGMIKLQMLLIPLQGNLLLGPYLSLIPKRR